MAELQAQRKAAQPTNKRTFGSVFKNPEHELSAGRMLEACGLRGIRDRRRLISPMHANFIENAGEATTADAVALIVEARRRALEQFGVRLEPEVQLLGPVDPHSPRRTSASRGEEPRMSRRAALAVARTPPSRSALSSPPGALGAPSRSPRCVVAALGLGYLRRAPDDPLLGSRRSRSPARQGEVKQDVRAALAPYKGKSLVAIDPGDVERALAAVPVVRSAHVDRAFPNTLNVQVESEVPLAVYRDGAKAWLIARDRPRARRDQAERPAELPGSRPRSRARP